MGQLVYTAPDGQVLDFGSGRHDIRLSRVLGTGIPDAMHQMAESAVRDGVQYTGRTRFEERYITVDIVPGPLCSYTAAMEARQRIVAVLNARLRSDPSQPLAQETGTLRWSPDPFTDYYIGAILDRGGAFDSRDMPDGFWRRMTLRFICPDPAWVSRVSTAAGGDAQGRTCVTFTTTRSGLSVPISVPISIPEEGEAAVLTNEGDVISYPLITVTGAFVGPSAENEDTGEIFDLPGLAVATGELLTIDLEAGTVDLDGVSKISHRTPESVSWGLVPGDNTVRVNIDGGEATFTVCWFTRLLGV